MSTKKQTKAKVVTTWRDIKKESPVISDERKADGYMWLPVIVFATDGVLTYTGEAVYYWQTGKFEIAFRFDNLKLDTYVVAWMPMLEKPDFL